MIRKSLKLNSCYFMINEWKKINVKYLKLNSATFQLLSCKTLK